MESANAAVTKAMERYRVPDWVKPYILKHAMTHPVSAVRFALSFIDTKRRKGEVTREYVRLPNGLRFRMDSILRVLNLFYYGEERIAHMVGLWSRGASERNAEYAEHFARTAMADERHARAIKNLIEGLGFSVGDAPPELVNVFDYVETLDSWSDRILATAVILRKSYADAFGFMFYKVFYPAAPEFMLSFGKAFRNSDAPWEFAEAKRIISEKRVSEEHALELTRSILSRVYYSVSVNMPLAARTGIEPEIRLLTEIAMAYPFHTLKSMGLNVNVRKEVDGVKRSVAAWKRAKGRRRKASAA